MKPVRLPLFQDALLIFCDVKLCDSGNVTVRFGVCNSLQAIPGSALAHPIFFRGKELILLHAKT